LTRLRPPAFDCHAYLCSTGWAQAHGLGSGCGKQSSAVNSAIGSAVEQGVRPIGEAIGQWLGNLLFGSPNPDNTAAVAEAERQRMLELERARQLEAERQARFRQDMQSLQLEMKGPKLPDESHLFKHDSTCILSTDCPDRVLEMKPINLSSAQQGFSGQLDKLRISSCLSKMAAEANSPDEAKYLSGEAAKAMQGEALDVDVSGCPSGTVATSVPLPPWTPVPCSCGALTCRVAVQSSTARRIE